MQTKINFTYSDSGQNSTTNVNLDEYCPHCGQPVMPIVVYSQASNLFKNIYNTIGVFLRCPRSECNKFFVQEFEIIKKDETSSIIKSTSEKIPYYLNPPIINELPKEINEAFPEFKSIYNQSLEAESMGLDQIAGIGFRKSLEFLMKSYAIYKDPDSQPKIEKETLNNTIQNRYSDFPKIQKLAELAAWIGNDETHFVKKHTEIDINDMKKFLRSAALFIAADMDVDFAATYIEENKK